MDGSNVVRLRDARREAPNKGMRHKDRRGREHLTEAEVNRLREAARRRGRHGHRDDTMILMAFRHGLRAAELCGLRWRDVQLDEAKLTIHRLKRGEQGTHPLAGVEIRALKRLKRESASSPFVFTTERGGPCTPNGFSKMLAAAAEAAGMGEIRVHAHMLRHSAGFHLAEQGREAYVIRDYLGHRELSSTGRYIAGSSTRFDGIFRD